jgi:hypothetical protein
MLAKCADQQIKGRLLQKKAGGEGDDPLLLLRREFGLSIESLDASNGGDDGTEG